MAAPPRRPAGTAATVGRDGAGRTVPSIPDPRLPRSRTVARSRAVPIDEGEMAMGAPELAVAWEQERVNGVWAMMAGVLAMQGVADIDADTLKAFHAVVPDGVVIEPVVYGTGSGRDLSGLLARPADATTTGDRPAVVLVHGGGWMSGHAAMHLRHAAFLAAQGYVALTINYRLAQEAEWPACRDDVVSALRWLRD